MKMVHRVKIARVDSGVKEDNEKSYFVSSGNLFADIGALNAEERFAKLELAVQINKLIAKKKLTQKAAAELLGVDQPKISALHKGKLAGFSLERLFRFLNVLGQGVTINVAPKKRTQESPNISVNFPQVKREPVDKVSTGARAAILAKKNNLILTHSNFKALG
jgi:Uncharacterized conserved small protein